MQNCNCHCVCTIPCMVKDWVINKEINTACHWEWFLILILISHLRVLIIQITSYLQDKWHSLYCTTVQHSPVIKFGIEIKCLFQFTQFGTCGGLPKSHNWLKVILTARLGQMTRVGWVGKIHSFVLPRWHGLWTTSLLQLSGLLYLSSPPRGLFQRPDLYMYMAIYM